MDHKTKIISQGNEDLGEFCNKWVDRIPYDDWEPVKQRCWQYTAGIIIMKGLFGPVRENGIKQYSYLGNSIKKEIS